MFRLISKSQPADDSLPSSRLFDQNSFYTSFIEDLKRAKSRVIIESPFMTTKRVVMLRPILRRLTVHRVRLVINTKPPGEQEPMLQVQAEQGIGILQELGAQVLLTGGHHRKLAIIDDAILWEGSLNILSQHDSCEVMRRAYSEQLVNQMLAFLRLEKFIG